MLLRKSSHKRHRTKSKNLLLAAAILLVALLASCLEIVKVNQPSSANVGEEITITIDARITDDAGSTLIFGFLAPRVWKASEFTTVRFESTIGNSNMTLIHDEVDVENQKPWVEQITDRVGFGRNYGEVEWIVFKADQSLTPPSETSPDSPVTGKITVKTKVGPSNLITQLGYFLGEADWGYLNDDGNSTYFFEEACIEITGATGQPQNFCGPAPRQLIDLETYTFNDLLTITFDAQEDTTVLIGATNILMCATAVLQDGSSSVCKPSPMQKIGNDIWQLTIWPPTFFGTNDGDEIAEILVNFQDESGMIVRDVSGNDFQILSKCF